MVRTPLILEEVLLLELPHAPQRNITHLSGNVLRNNPIRLVQPSNASALLLPIFLRIDLEVLNNVAPAVSHRHNVLQAPSAHLLEAVLVDRAVHDPLAAEATKHSQTTNCS